MPFTYPVTLSVLPSLRRGGVKISIKHKRYLYCTDSHDCETITGLTSYGRHWESDYGMIPYPLGVETTITLTFPDGGTYTGVATCSLQDRFCRRTGIAVALERALAQREIDRTYVDLNDPPPNQAARKGFADYSAAVGYVAKTLNPTKPIPYNPKPSATIHPR